jgi:hypothetical protein
VDERHLVHVPGHLGEDFRDPFAALAVLGEFKRRLHQAAHVVGEEAGEAVEVRQLLAVAFFQFRLVVPRIDVARTTVDEQPDDGAGLGGKVDGLGASGSSGCRD